MHPSEIDWKARHEALEKICNQLRLSASETAIRCARLQNDKDRLQAQINAATGRVSAADAPVDENAVGSSVDAVIKHLNDHLVRGGKLRDLGDAVDRSKRDETASGAIGRTTRPMPHGGVF